MRMRPTCWRRRRRIIAAASPSPVPNEELPAARPLKTTPAYGAFQKAGAAFGALYGWEYPLWFAGEGKEAKETPTFRRSEAFARIGEESKAVREAVGLFESSCYAKFDVTGSGAAAFLDRLSSNKLPQADGKTALAPLLTPKGQVFGDLTVTRLAADRYLMIGSPTAIVYYQRWFDRHRGADDVTIRDVTADWTGFSLTGPKARDVLAELVSEDISHQAFPFLSARRMTVGLAGRDRDPRQLHRRVGLRDLHRAGIPAACAGAAARRGQGAWPEALRHARAELRCGWKRATAPGAASSASTTRRQKRGSAASCGSTRATSSGVTPRNGS